VDRLVRVIDMADKIRVLYVDDEPALLSLGKIFLERLGDFSVTTSIIVTEAIKLLEKEAFDIILSDYQMPVMDGIGFLKYLKSNGDATPFILFTGRGREEVAIEALNNGADFYLQKGGDPKAQFTELSNTIRHTVSRRRMELDLLESQQRILEIIDFLPDATFAIDNNGIVIAWNHAIEEMTGYGKSEIIGQGEYIYSIPFYGERRKILLDLVSIHDEDLEKKYESFQRKGHTISSEVFVPLLNNGKGAYLWCIVTSLFDTYGNIVGAIESLRDITERKRTEDDLLKKNDDLQAAYEEIAATDEELRNNYEKLIQKDEQIRRNEERLIMAEKIGRTGCWEYDRNLGTFWGSSEALRIFGFPPESVDLSLDAVEACVDEHEIAHQIFVDFVNGRCEYDIYQKIYPFDGSEEKIIHSVAKLETDSNGEKTRVVGVIQDVTEEKKAEKELLLANKILEAVIKQAPFAAVLLSGDPHNIHVILSNDLSSKIMNENLENISFFDARSPQFQVPRFFTIDDKKEIQFENLPGPRALLGECIKNQELIFRHPDGFEIIVEINAFPIFDENNRIIAGAVFCQDITKRKKDEIILKKTNHTFEMAQKLAKMGTLEYYPKENLLKWSDGLFRIFGLNPGSFNPTFDAVCEMIHPDDLAGFSRILQNAMETGESYSHKYRVINPDKSVHVIRVFFLGIRDDKGEIIRLIGICQDITDIIPSDQPEVIQPGIKS